MAAKTPDLNLLPIAIALYDELNVSRAARQLGMSQPAVSRALRRLRETFDDPLFVRGPSGIVPTPRAHEIVGTARSHLQHLREGLLKGERFDPVTSTRPIVLGLSDVAEMAFLPSILDHLRVHAPKCPVSTATVPDAQLAEGLEKGDVDVAAGFFPALAQRNFRQRRLTRHGFACLMRAGHPLWRSRLTVSAYLAAEHIVIRRAGRSQEVLERFIERRKMRRKVAMYTSNVLSVPFIVMDTQLVATLPYAVVTRFVTLTPQLAAALPPFDVTYDLKLHWHRRFDNEPRSIWLREQLAVVFKDHQWLQPPAGPAPFLEP
ncbi:MAG TPA: LysR family transcriptional regulator [Vicinamibacterales bacterium]|nr:LysR family transcriptional regulator [Vicinamibacterales bacterium]